MPQFLNHGAGELWIISLFFILVQYCLAYYENSELLKALKRQNIQNAYPKHYDESYYDTDSFENNEANIAPLPKWDAAWPAEYVSFDLGQIGGLAVCPEGNVHVFHRGSRVWNYNTFDGDDNYMLKDEGALPEAIEILSRSDGKCLERLGKDKFYLPHGLTLDNNKHYWLTDVATHEVHKYDIESDSIILTLGKQFQHATDMYDTEKFCKPSDVAIAPSGDIFISDGYCNHRVIKFSDNGTFLGQIGTGELTLPHSITLIPDRDLVCVADRESSPSRIVCYTAGLTDNDMGEKVNEILMNSAYPLERVYAIAYNPRDDAIYAVTQKGNKGYAYTIRFVNGKLQEDSTWDLLSEKEFDQPHDIAVSPNGDVVYVGMISEGQRKVWKFDV